MSACFHFIFRRLKLALAVASLVIAVAPPAQAGLYAEFNGFYSTDAFTTASTANASRTYYALDLHTNLENKNRFYGGFHVDQVASTDDDGAGLSATMSSLNMGPMLMWIMDHKKTFSLAAGYNVVARGTYDAGKSGSAELSGTGMWGSFGVTPEISENWYVGFRLTYYSLAYVKSTSAGVAADVSYSRTMIFPTFAVAWRY